MPSLTTEAPLLPDIADSPTGFVGESMVAVVVAVAVVAGVKGLHGVELQIVGAVMGLRLSRNGMSFKL